MDAFQFRKLTAAPATGDTIAVYVAGSARDPGNLVANLTDLDGAALANPFTVAAAGGVDQWGFIPSAQISADIWWEEGGLYLAKSEQFDSTIPAASSQAEAEAGTEAGLRSWSPVRVWQAVAAKVAAMIGTTAGTVAAGDHGHSGVYEPADVTILKDADIGVTVQAYDQQLASLAELSYADNAAKVIGVKATEDGFELVTPAPGGGSVDVQTFAADGTWTKPAGVTNCLVKVWGAGGGGEAGILTAANGAGGSGGGGGGHNFALFKAADLGATESVIVGAGGSGGVAGGAAATAGGASNFAAKLYAYGGGIGKRGVASAYSNPGGGGGSASTFGANATGDSGVKGGGFCTYDWYTATNVGGYKHSIGFGGGSGYGGATGGQAEYGGGGGGGAAIGGYAGGASLFGGGGGGGGAGGTSSTEGGDGGASGVYSLTGGSGGAKGTAASKNGTAGAAGSGVRGGNGGGGGASGGNNSTNGGTGGSGGTRGGGGGGGGSTVSGGTAVAGNGGAGGAGYVEVISW